MAKSKRGRPHVSHPSFNVKLGVAINAPMMRALDNMKIDGVKVTPSSAARYYIAAGLLKDGKITAKDLPESAEAKR
jgi:hypothetical protein